MRIYVAGPYSAPSQAVVRDNVERALAVGLRLMRRGHVPFVPHLSYWLDELAATQGNAIPYESWLAYDCEWLRLCDALYLLAPSPGADREVMLAEGLWLPIYRSLEEVPSPATPQPMPPPATPPPSARALIAAADNEAWRRHKVLRLGAYWEGMSAGLEAAGCILYRSNSGQPPLPLDELLGAVPTDGTTEDAS
jgi:hypothetical protein